MEKRMIDTTYCYIEDTMGENWGKNLFSDFIDPDSRSKRLYEDMRYIWANLPDGRYSPDFIGANRTQADRIGLDKDEIIRYLKVQRTIGGHMLFPVISHLSINQARGCNMLDRFDFTLAELREYFLFLCTEGKNEQSYEKKYSIQLKNSFMKEENKKWLNSVCEGKKGIEAFRAFIDYFLLDMFVDRENECKVLSLACSDLRNKEKRYVGENDEPYFPGLIECPKMVVLSAIRKRFESMEKSRKECIREAYRQYIRNTDYAIEQRNAAIKKRLSIADWGKDEQ